MTDRELIIEIMKKIQLPGEDYTDGECMDEIITLIEESGFDFNWDEWHANQLKYVGRKVLPLSTSKKVKL
jgi:hypothetical protein